MRVASSFGLVIEIYPTMATNYEPLSLAERPDIHKSCKSLETLLNVLNDYCEAIGNVAILQKKLAKALRETAGIKITGEIAGNAMNTSAVIFEALSDIDSKFAKVADKEYDGISTEVKKWFKRLTKEEKAHDEKMANGNTKIKQAGQIYEKKSKKGTPEVAEEHTRYVNLINTLGPQMSQEKYNHALNVTQRHTSTTYSAAACLSRIADAEWLRAFEGVRRFSPIIGQLGEWRALCEGGWIGPMPQGLPDLDKSQLPQPDPELVREMRAEDELQAPTTLRNLEARESSRETAERNSPLPKHSITTGPERPQGLLSSPRQLPTATQSYSSESLIEYHFNSAESPLDTSPLRPFANHSDSIRSLSAFPSPPTHFPIPPSRQQQSSQSQSSQSSSYLKPRLTESPLPGEDGDRAETSLPSLEPQRGSPSAQQMFQDKYHITDVADIGSTRPSEDNAKHPVPSHAQPSSSPAPSEAITPGGFNSRAPVHARGGYLAGMNEREFGVNIGYKPKAHTMDNVKSASIDRSDTSGSNGSMVAAIRHRYSTAAGSPSAVRKDVSRLPLSVNDLANRYQSVDGPSSSRAGPSSPPPLRQLPLVPSISNTSLRQSNSYQELTSQLSPSTAGGTPTQDDEASRRRRQGVDELAELELKENQMELREREHEIEMRARELERDYLRMTNAREEEGVVNGYIADGSRRNPEHQPQLLRPLRPRSQLDMGQALPNASNNLAPLSPLRPRFSHDTTHLTPPSNSSLPFTSPDSRTVFNSSSRQSSQQHEDKPPHAPSCGCETCSIAKYRSPSSAQSFDFRPPAKPLILRPVEKSRPGWIRRLSVPVGNAFNLESKKGIGNIAGLGSSKNGSTVSFGTAIHHDGRRSYEANINRSVTNLGMGGGQ